MYSNDSIYNIMQLLNIPSSGMTRKNIKNNIIKITDDYNNELVNILPDIMVSDEYTDTFNEAYFNTTITGKEVYASLHLYGGYLPVERPVRFVIINPGETVDNSIWEYKKVVFDTETTLYELYKNAYHYQYNSYTDTFIKLTTNGAIQNSLKLYMQKHIMEIGGDPYDRIADLSRIIIFLLSKVTLTDEEKNIINPLLQYNQSINDLASVLEREKEIQEYVAHVKEDPGAYLNE